MSDFVDGLRELVLNIKGFIFFGVVGGTILIHLLMRKDIWSFLTSLSFDVMKSPIELEFFLTKLS